MNQCQGYCDWMCKRIKIKSNGLVQMCCMQTSNLGNLFDMSLEEIWKNKARLEAIEIASTGAFPKLCEVPSRPCWAFGKQTLRIIDNVRADYPTQLEVDLPSSHCNIGYGTPTDNNPACIMCSRNATFQQEPNLTKEICLKVRPWITEHLEEFFLGGVAEPFLHGKIFEVLDWIEYSRHAETIQFRMTTNALMMTERYIDLFLGKCPKSLTFVSFDAARPTTYQKIRRIDGLAKVHTNTGLLCKRKTKNQLVILHNNINLLNVDEMAEMVEKGAELGVDGAKFLLTFDPGYGYTKAGILDEILMNKKNYKLFESEWIRAVEAGRKTGLPVEFPQPFTMRKDFVMPPVAPQDSGDFLF